ncbi:hypothetical protein BAE44_0003553 [Dichanthelium oligosanthes]|uniref:Uncharacterized protein n=1 Tax=Dichanthelium oligosanthes TaxID=888268 RepID=A0A1E5WDE3_9POAL|nr:hypothetical protein BAE44_0003553 [Dichanthelium oligosanthes]
MGAKPASPGRNLSERAVSTRREKRPGEPNRLREADYEIAPKAGAKLPVFCHHIKWKHSGYGTPSHPLGPYAPPPDAPLLASALSSSDSKISGGECEFRVGDRYLLRYDRRIAGMARAGSIRTLQGVSVKVLFVWLGISEVDRAREQLSFLIGPLAASFTLGNFAESPRCRRGFDCTNAAATAAEVNAVAAS